MPDEEKGLQNKMSIKTMTRVWEDSDQGGSDLLLLLAIADNADDTGFAWPGQKYLAKKIRMSERTIPRITSRLMDAGELYINHRSDEGKSNQYIVIAGLDEETFVNVLKYKMQKSDDEIIKSLKWFRGGGDKVSPPPPPDNLSGGDDIAVSGGDDIAVSPEPSLTVKETKLPKGNGDSSPPSPIKKPKTAIKDKFLELTNLDMPTRKSDVGFWWSTFGEILKVFRRDVDRANAGMVIVVRYMKNEDLTITGPQSIVNLCRAVASGQQLGGNKRNGKPNNVPRDKSTIPLTQENAMVYRAIEQATVGMSLTRADV